MLINSRRCSIIYHRRRSNERKLCMRRPCITFIKGMFIVFPHIPDSRSRKEKFCCSTFNSYFPSYNVALVYNIFHFCVIYLITSYWHTFKSRKRISRRNMITYRRGVVYRFDNLNVKVCVQSIALTKYIQSSIPKIHDTFYSIRSFLSLMPVDSIHIFRIRIPIIHIKHVRILNSCTYTHR